MELFTTAHIAAITVTALGALLLATLPRRLTRRQVTIIGRALALAIAAAFAIEQITYVARGDWRARANLPLQLSDVVTLVAVVALWRPRPGILTELVWFWGLTATLQAVLTPDINDDYPDILFFTYFATHGGAVLAAALLVLGLHMTPRPGAAWRVYGVTAAVAGVAAVGCLATGGNYMFLRHKPSSGSILDPLGPWPWYVLAAAALGLAMLLVVEALTRMLAQPADTTSSS